MPEPTTMFFHPALHPGSSSFFFSSSSGSDDDGAGAQLLQVRVEVPPSTPLLDPTAGPDAAGSSPAAVAFVVVYWAFVVAGLVLYWHFF